MNGFNLSLLLILLILIHNKKRRPSERINTTLALTVDGNLRLPPPIF